MRLVYTSEIISVDSYTTTQIEELKNKYQCRVKVHYFCETCGESVSKELRSYKNNLCKKCNFKKVCNEKYGCDAPAQNKEILQKQQNKIKLKRNEINEKISKARKAKTKEQNEEINIKRKKTLYNRYGSETYNNRNKAKETMTSLYNGETTLTSDLKSEVQNTNISKYGGISPMCSKTIQEKSKNNYIEHNGGMGFGSEKTQEKYIQTMNEKYGVNNCSQIKEVFNKQRQKITFDNKNFDSNSELIYYIWLKDHNGNFEYQPDDVFEYEVNNKKHYYNPDFKVNNQFVEIKGLHFFENCDVKNKMICPYHYSEDTEEDIKNRNELFEAKHQCMLKNNVKIITDISEYETYVNEKYTKNYINLFRNNLEFPYLNNTLKDTSDYGIIQHFHESIYEARRNNKLSPLEAWNNKDIIKKVALNRLKYVGKCKPSDILQGMNVMKISPKVSVFKPQLAEYIIKKYLNEYDTIFDPFSGFSGRMIGSKNCGKKYIGQDINKKHVLESNEIIKFKNYTDCSVTEQDIITDDIKEYDCLFTCSPYGIKEIWNENEVNKTCDEWIDICREKYKCKKYCFVVDVTTKYKDNIVEEIENKSHFGINKEYIVLI